MMKRIFVLLGMALCSMAICLAQQFNIDEEIYEIEKFVSDITEEFNSFRRQSMAQFAEFVRNPWVEFKETKPVPKPAPTPVPPVVIDDDKDLPIEDNPIVIDEVLNPIKGEPQPQPVEPIEEVPDIEPSYMEIMFFGTSERVRCDISEMPDLCGVSEGAVASMLARLSVENNDNLIFDCLEIRKKRNLSDWAYLQMLNEVAAKIYRDQPNEAQVLLAYLFIQSGYKARLASDGNSLYMLFASKHVIFDKSSYVVDGDSYYGLKELPGQLHICEASFPNEQSLSLLIQSSQQLAFEASESRTISSERYSNVCFDVSVNKNLLDFYSTYPESALDGNVMTRWAMIANVPIDPNVSATFYPVLKTLLSGKSELEATNVLLNVLQTGLKYEFDNVVWGDDRTFFAEETLFYPYCDCEDRAVLLTRLVKDILGLNCLLVYYPGHLAAAIEYSDRSVKGDYIVLDGHKYIIADPTFINAAIGRTMPGMNNSSAKVIRVK